ncbi:MAG: peptidoglycan/LPS O-acetylase OafA/YrhL [bacterium]|jgi:peptidoglycan/LPS O-acetylase OafA/YrhL
MRLVALDLIRFFAAMSVVLYHYTAREQFQGSEYISGITKYGYLGVPLFFMISGYVIALSARNRKPVEFVISRFVRLYPAYWSGIIVTLCITYFIGNYSTDIYVILANATMLNDYFGIENIDGVYWTLQAELKFYFCIFLLLVFGVFEKYKIWLTIWLLLAWGYLITQQPYFLGWFISPGYSSFFIAGIAFYLIQINKLGRFNFLVLFSSLILSSINAFEQTEKFFTVIEWYEKWVAVVIVFSFYLVFHLLISKRLILKPRRVYTTLGGITYPLYLIHGLGGITIIDYYGGVDKNVTITFITLLLMLFISWLIHVNIEKGIASPLKHFLLNKFK